MRPHLLQTLHCCRLLCTLLLCATQWQTTVEAVRGYMRLHSAYYRKCKSVSSNCKYYTYSAASGSCNVSDHVSDHVRTLGHLSGLGVVVTFGDQMVRRPAVTGSAATEGTLHSAAMHVHVLSTSRRSVYRPLLLRTLLHYRARPLFVLFRATSVNTVSSWRVT
jgi:hypothetical protein